MKKIIVLFIALNLAGCATKYQSEGISGGYSETKLNENTYQIKVTGNGFTSAERANDIALLRASDLTIKEGGERFIVLEGNISQKYVGSSPITINRIGDTAIIGGGHSKFKPSGIILIQIVKANDPRYSAAIDAKLVQSQLKSKLE